jgi:hypothetical protein
MFKKWFKNFIADTIEEVKEEGGYSKQFANYPGSSTCGESIDQDRGFRFHIFAANGGHVVQTFRYDQKKDENKRNLYIVTHDQELGHEISKIITMDLLR